MNERYSYYSRHPLRPEFVHSVRRIKNWYLIHKANRVVVEEYIDGENRRFIMPSIKDLEEDFHDWTIPYDQVRSIRDYWNNLFIEGACSWLERKHAIHLSMKYLHYYYRCQIYIIEI